MSTVYGISGKNNSKPYNAESTRYENKEIRIVRKYFQVNRGNLRNDLFQIYFRKIIEPPELTSRDND